MISCFTLYPDNAKKCLYAKDTERERYSRKCVYLNKTTELSQLFAVRAFLLPQLKKCTKPHLIFCVKNSHENFSIFVTLRALFTNVINESKNTGASEKCSCKYIKKEFSK